MNIDITKITPSSARELLQHHAGRHSDIDHPKSVDGFLGSLRSNNNLRAENFHEVMACLNVLASELENQATCDREIMAALWGICHLGRAWGIDPDGMLRRNALISAEQANRLESWINQISYTTFCLLDGCGVDVAFEFYDDEEL